MTAQIIDGRHIAAEIRESVSTRAMEFANENNRPPCLAVVLVGNDPASEVYVKMKEKAAFEVGIRSVKHTLPIETTEEELLRIVSQLGEDQDVDGILVQLPLPDHISESHIIEAVNPGKDVDGFHPVNAWHLVMGNENGFKPCTPAGIIQMIRRTGIAIEGKEAVVVGRSTIVGKPLSQLLLADNATVTICHSRTRNLEEVCQRADLLIVAIGRPRFIGRHHIKPGAVVIDVGVNRLADGKLAGDVDFDSVKEVAGYLTPVPGGVGPMTIAMLMQNTLDAAIQALK